MSKRGSDCSAPQLFGFAHFFAIPGRFFFWKEVKNNVLSPAEATCPILSDMNNNSVVNLIAPTRELKASGGPFGAIRRN